MEHFANWELVAYVDGAHDLVDVERIRTHLSRCQTCAGELEAIRSNWDAMTDPIVHHAAAAGRRAPEMPADLRGLVDAYLRPEHATPMATLSRLPATSWPDAVAAHPEWKSEQLVRELVSRAREQFESNPSAALPILEAARTAARRIFNAHEAAAARSVVSKEMANALRMLGRYPEALEELEEAERLLADVTLPDYDLAFIRWTRAIVLLHMTRYEEALTESRRAIRTFRDYGDHHRAMLVGMVEAGILYEQGQVKEARDHYLALSELTLDDLTLARVHGNLAECSMRLDEGDSAIGHARQAIDLYTRCGALTEVVRVRWTLAHGLLRTGSLEDALASLEEVRASFLELGLRGDAAAVLLDIIELHVQREEWDEALRKASMAAEAFLSMKAPVHVAQAYAHLRQALKERSITSGDFATARSMLSAATETWDSAGEPAPS